jgi:hypothetical protein
MWKCGIIGVAMATVQVGSVLAQNLLEKATVSVTASKADEADSWVPKITFTKQGKQSLRLRSEFTVDALPSAVLLTLKKPLYISEWMLNGKALMGPPKDMFFPEWEGIPSSALKIGKNVLEASFSLNVNMDKGKLKPASTGGIKLELVPGDIQKFEIRTGPVLGAAGLDYFTVGCRTRMPATVTLQCDGRTWTSKPGVIRRLRADGLKEGKEYEYKLVASLIGAEATASSKSWKVKTLSSKGPWTFIALGDARNNPKIWGRITAEAMKFKPDFVMHSGDIIGNGNDYEAWDKEFSKPAEEFLATIPCFYTFGNHENNVSLLYEFFGFPQDDRSSYAQVIGPLQLFALNRFENWGKDSANLVRMEKELAESKASFIFAFTHPPAWSSGSHGNDSLGKDIHFPIFEKYGVTALIAGHDHCYERSEPGKTTMLIAGGAGAHLYKPEHAKENPYSKIYRSEYSFLVFQTDGTKCSMKAYAYGGLDTPDEQRKIEEIDTREWVPRPVK